MSDVQYCHGQSQNIPDKLAYVHHYDRVTSLYMQDILWQYWSIVSLIPVLQAIQSYQPTILSPGNIQPASNVYHVHSLCSRPSLLCVSIVLGQKTSKHTQRGRPGTEATCTLCQVTSTCTCTYTMHNKHATVHIHVHACTCSSHKAADILTNIDTFKLISQSNWRRWGREGGELINKFLL